MKNYLAFDIEIAKVTDSGANLEAERPLGISCYALAWVGEKGDIITYTGHGYTHTGTAPKMNQAECMALVGDLLTRTEQFGATLLTHNGAGFDLDILAEESGQYEKCVRLARNSVDTMLHFHCLKGFPVGLDAIAKGMGLSGKTEGMHGDLAPVMWQEGRYDEVLAYVAQDARSTLEVALAVEQAGVAKWIAKSGRLNSVAIREWLTVEQSLRLPYPNVSWMDSPWPREKFVGWMSNYGSK